MTLHEEKSVAQFANSLFNSVSFFYLAILKEPTWLSNFSKSLWFLQLFCNSLYWSCSHILEYIKSEIKIISEQYEFSRNEAFDLKYIMSNSPIFIKFPVRALDNKRIFIILVCRVNELIYRVLQGNSSNTGRTC
jgi:hypothetical protein